MFLNAAVLSRRILVKADYQIGAQYQGKKYLIGTSLVNWSGCLI